MLTLRAKHLGSGRGPEHWPKPALPEYAFIGRSNVGKSSLINMLTGIGKLARVSNTPGRTRNVEHFRVEGSVAADTSSTPWLLADLPGYGFAKVSIAERAEWKRMIEDYLLHRPNLCCVFLLVDVRLEPQRKDMDMLHWLGEQGIPFCIVFTKSDKLKQPQVVSHVAAFRRALRATWQTLPHMFITSADSSKGRQEMLAFVQHTNAVWKPPNPPEA
jgi:GTP-binding protein